MTPDMHKKAMREDRDEMGQENLDTSPTDDSLIAEEPLDRAQGIDYYRYEEEVVTGFTPETEEASEETLRSDAGDLEDSETGKPLPHNTDTLNH